MTIVHISDQGMLSMETGLNNNEEMLEIWDWETARPTGRVVSRNRAHLEGIPHEGVHLWIVSNRNNIPAILFQHRAPHKELFPDCLDITVGGHVPFGLAGNKIEKEAWEEIGISVEEDRLISLGIYRYEERSETFFHRELQKVYLTLDNRELDRYSFIDGEVDGIYAVPIRDCEEMLIKDVTFPVEGFDGRSIITRNLSRSDFHPSLFDESMEVYVDIVLRASKELVETGRVKTRMPLDR